MIIAMMLYAILGVLCVFANVSTAYYIGIIAVVMAIDVWSHYCAKTGKLK